MIMINPNDYEKFNEAIIEFVRDKWTGILEVSIDENDMSTMLVDKYSGFKASIETLFAAYDTPDEMVSELDDILTREHTEKGLPLPQV